MSGTGEALAPGPAGPQRAAEAGGGRRGSPGQGECVLASCKLLCHCCIVEFVHTFTDWGGVGESGVVRTDSYLVVVNFCIVSFTRASSPGFLP